MKPSFYKQYDSRWAKHSWKGVTVGGSGCGPTAIANVVTALKKKKTPKQVFDWICKNGYMTIGSGTYWAGITAALKHYGITKFKVTSSASNALKCLRKGHWLIGVVGPSRWTRGGHYILLYGIDSNNHLKISDSASSSDYREKDGPFSEYKAAECMQWIDIDPSDYVKKKKKTQTSTKYTLYVCEDYVNVREGAGTSYGIRGKIKFNTAVTLTKSDGDWYKIAKGTYKGGYVHISNFSKYKQEKATYQLLTAMNLRKGYTTKSDKIKVVKKGTKLNSTKKRGNWAYFPKQKGISKAGFICIKDENSTYLKKIK